ncbi:MAG: GbsR/MarR family transcriptional regulator, partial [Streptosporangiaceae bacterium]
SGDGVTAGPGPRAGAGAGAGADQAVSQFAERFAGALTEMGVPRMPARVFVALLTCHAGRLTAAEIGADLQASPAAVSGAVRYLVQIGLVLRASEPGTRRLAYSVPEDVWQHMITARNAEMARWARIFREGADLLSDGPAGARVAETAEYFDFVVGELPGVQARWEQYRARQGK